MYGSDFFKGLAGCLIVLVVFASVGLCAFIFGAWWLFSNIDISWGR